MSTYTIRLVDYMGGWDDLNEVNIIGPYPSAAERDAAIRRLAQVKGFYGCVELFPATTTPDAADNSCGPLTVADVATVRELLAAVHGYDYDPAEDDDLIEADR